MKLETFSSQSFDRGASRVAELIWYLMRALFFMHSIPLPSRLKVAILRAFGASIGKGVVIRSRVNITFPWRIQCGDHTWIGDDVMILSLAQVRIGSSVCISQRAFLCTGSHDFDKESFDLITKPICIEESSWVGAQSFVGPGVTMGVRSRSLAGAVVVTDVEPGMTVGGVPAKAVSYHAAGNGGGF